MEVTWAEGDDRERRVFTANLLEGIKVFPDHLEVKIAGSPPINLLYSKVGLKVPVPLDCWCPIRPDSIILIPATDG